MSDSGIPKKDVAAALGLSPQSFDAYSCMARLPQPDLGDDRKRYSPEQFEQLKAAWREWTATYFNATQTAERLGVSYQEFRRLIRNGIVPGPQHQFGRRWYYSADAIKQIKKQLAKRTKRTKRKGASGQ